MQIIIIIKLSIDIHQVVKDGMQLVVIFGIIMVNLLLHILAF